MAKARKPTGNEGKKKETFWKAVSARTGAKAGGSKKTSRGKKRPLLPDLIRKYIEHLGHSEESFRKALEEFRGVEIKGTAGPCERTFADILAKGKASEDFYGSILRFIQSKLAQAYKEGTLTPRDAPMVRRLDQWPTVVEGEMTLDECVQELSRIVRVSAEPRVLYASTGTGIDVMTLLKALRGDAKNISEIVLRRPSERWVCELKNLGWIGDGFEYDTCCHIELLRSARYTKGMVVKHEVWNNMAPFHGMMYGEVMFWGAWQYSCGSLNTDGPMFKLMADDVLFEIYESLLVSGDSNPDVLTALKLLSVDRCLWRTSAKQ